MILRPYASAVDRICNLCNCSISLFNLFNLFLKWFENCRQLTRCSTKKKNDSNEKRVMKEYHRYFLWNVHTSLIPQLWICLQIKQVNLSEKTSKNVTGVKFNSSLPRFWNVEMFAEWLTETCSSCILKYLNN